MKYIPIIQMVGMLFNNTMYYYENVYSISYILDYLIGNSLITTALLFVCSYIFGFCKWYRLIILANIVNITIANIDALWQLPISDVQLLASYYVTCSIFIIIGVYSHVNKKKTMKLKLQVLKSLLLETIANIDAGNSNRSEEELEEIIQVLTKLNRGIHRISKAYACEHILYCSPSTFDNYIKLGIIPKGRKEYGFKELS